MKVEWSRNHGERSEAGACWGNSVTPSRVHSFMQNAWPPPPYRIASGWTPPVPPRTAPKPSPLRARELAALVAIAIVCDVALWGSDGRTPGGYALSLFFVALAALLFAAARGRRLSARLAAIVSLLALIAVRAAFSPTAGTVVAGLGLVFAFTFALRARRVFVPELALSALAALALLPSRIGAAFAGARSLARKTPLVRGVGLGPDREPSSSSPTSGAPVQRASLLPIVVPLALVAVFLGIFALANPLVAHGLGVVGEAIARLVGLPSPGRIFFWLFTVCLAASLLRPAIRLARGTEAAEPASEASPTALLVARNALVALNLLFFANNVLDATYLWAGSPPPGVATQRYAHEGAFWLTIALVMLTAVIGVMFRGALAHDPRAKLGRTLAYAWIAQGLVLALGTYRRIAMHIVRSGLSDLRIVGILGTTLVVGGVVFVAWKLHRQRRFTWLVRRQLDAFAVTLALYAVLPTHLVSAHVNVARIGSGEYRPLLHMFTQAARAESAAAVLPLLDHPEQRVREGVAALLEDERDRLRSEVSHADTWRERDLASRRTLAALDAAAPKITAILGSVDHPTARRALLEISRAANEDRSIEELLAVPASDDPRRESYVE